MKIILGNKNTKYFNKDFKKLAAGSPGLTIEMNFTYTPTFHS